MKSFSAFILIVIFCAPTARAANNGSVSGQLTDAQDKPVPGTKVQVTAASSAKRLRLLHCWLPRRRKRRSPPVIRLIRLSYQELSLTRLGR